MKAKHRRLITYLVTVSLLGFGISWTANRCTQDPIQSTSLQHLQSKTIVKDWVKWVVKPDQLLAGSNISFRISLESTQNPVALQEDLSKIALLHLNQAELLIPQEWDVSTQDDYLIEGTLWFELPELKIVTLELSLDGWTEKDDMLWLFEPKTP